MVQQFPGLPHAFVAEAVACSAVAFQPSVYVNAVFRPAHVCKQFIDYFIVLKAFRGAAEADKIVRIFRGKRFCRCCGVHVQVTGREDFSSEIRHIAVYPFLSVEALLDFPGLLGVPYPFRVVIAEVNDDHLVVRHF